MRAPVVMIDKARLAESIGQLDAGTRALLDLSLRRAIPDEQVAKVLGVEPSSIPPRRARGIAALADLMEIPGPAELAALLIAIPELPEHAWAVPTVAPFRGRVSRMRRASAFRRVAMAASPLVALGAVIAAVVVASGVDNSGHLSLSAADRQSDRGAAGGTAQPAAAAGDARHGLPPGLQLTLTPQPAGARRHATKAHVRHRSHRRLPGAAEPAILTRSPSPVPETEPVVLHTSPEPRHVTQHHHSHSTPKSPTHTPSPAPSPAPAPAPAPVQQPPTPVSSPSPGTQNGDSTKTVDIYTPATPVPRSPSAPKPPKTSVPPTNTNPWDGDGGDDDQGDDDGDYGGGGGGGDCSGDRGHDHSDGHWGGSGSAQSHGASGQAWTPPGIFRKRHLHG